MITIVMGAPGQGKSTYLALQAKKSMNKNVPVFSNVNMKGTIKYSVKNDLGISLIEHCNMVLDEAGREINARDYRNFTRDQYNFFSQHRHYMERKENNQGRGNIWLGVQFWDRCDISVRELTQKIIVMQPTIFSKWLICAVDVRVRIGVNEQEKIDEMFTMAHWLEFLTGGRRYYLKKPAWEMFDSWSRDLDLTEQDWQLWSDWKTKKQRKLEKKEKVKANGGIIRNITKDAANNYMAIRRMALTFYNRFHNSNIGG